MENKLLDQKCKIYYLLLNQKVIDDKQFNFLLQNEEQMGPVYKIKIDVKNMSKELTLYAAYDVVYLPRLYLSFPKNDLYEKLLPQITSLVFITKNNNFIEKQTEILNRFNLFKYNDINLIEYYKHINFSNSEYPLLFEINYFKKFLTMITKLFTYIHIVNNNTTFLKKIKLIK